MDGPRALNDEPGGPTGTGGYSFVEALRRERGSNATTAEGSAVIRVSENERLGHLLQFSALSTEIYPGKVITLEGIVDIDFGGFLAIHHFNTRSNAVVPNLSSLLAGCDVYLTQKIYDTQFSQTRAGQHLTNILKNQTEPQPTGLIGDTSSATSATSAVVTSALQIPQVSCCATSRSLDPQVQPFFTRTIPSNQADARAVVAYLAHLGVTHMGVLYGDNEYGRDFSKDVQQYAISFEIVIFQATFTYDDPVGADLAMSQLAESEVRYIFCILSPSQIAEALLLEAAEANGIVGDGYTWIFSENFADFTTDEQIFNSTTDGSSIRALNGSAVVLLSVPEHAGYNGEALRFQDDSELQEFYLQSHEDPGVLKGVNFTEWNYGSSFYGQLNYDAAMAMAISTCSAGRQKADFPTGADLFHGLVGVEFDGASGPVKIDPETGARSYQGLAFTVFNLIAGAPDSDGMVNFVAQPTSTIDLEAGTVRADDMFIYAGGTTEIPAPLPPLQETKQLIEPGALIFGYVFCAVLISMSLGWMFWTFYYREKRVVKAAQPIFLGLLCSGTLLMACAIIPMSFQDSGSASQEGLNAACMAAPYLLSLGFTTCFATLYSKLRRIKSLMKAAQSFKRVTIRPQDVIIPLASLLTVNVALLIAWTMVSPLEWIRRPLEGSYDRFGRATVTAASCRAEDQRSATGFIAALVVVNLVSVMLSLKQCYHCRNLPVDYNETEYIAISTWGLLEGMLIGLPAVWLASENETASYTVQVMLIGSFCLSVTLPMFVPKAIKHLKRRSTTETRQVSSRFSNEGSWPPSSHNPGGSSHKKFSALRSGEIDSNPGDSAIASAKKNKSRIGSGSGHSDASFA